MHISLTCCCCRRGDDAVAAPASALVVVVAAAHLRQVVPDRGAEKGVHADLEKIPTKIEF